MARDVFHFFDDFLHAIDLIGRFTDGYSEATFLEDERTYYAVERLLEIISEAARGVPPDMQDLRPEIPWPRMRAFGNVLRHEYFGVAPDLIWGVVADELPKLKTAISALREIKQ